MRPSPREGGFTLLELMAALVAGLVAISAIYAVGSGSARHFQEQQRIAQTQMALRMAMAQLRADVQRAGLYGTPNSATANPPNLSGCPGPATGRLQAVLQRDDVDTAAFPLFANPTNNNGNGVDRIEFDRLELVGNYSTTGAYLITGAAHPNQVRLQDTWQGFRRDFVTAGGTPDAVALGAAFAANVPGQRMLHVRTLQDTSVFTRVTGFQSGGTGVFINVQDPMPIASPCMPGLGDGASVAPLTRIEYAVVDPNTDADLAPLRTANTDAERDRRLGLTPSVLVRRELPFGSNTPIPGTTRVVLEYVADFDVSLVYDDAAPGVAPTLKVASGAAAEALSAANPEQIRSAIVRLSVRTPGTTPQFAATPRAANAPLTRFEINGAPGAARVRTLETEIFLPNLVPPPAPSP